MTFTLTESTLKPTWVKQLAFKPDFQSDTEKPFNVVKTQVTDVGEITILSNSVRFVRLEKDKNNYMSAISANFFFITLNNGLYTDCPLDEGDEIWVERSNYGLNLSVLHIYPPDKVELFDRVINWAQENNLRPFPNYSMNLS